MHARTGLHQGQINWIENENRNGNYNADTAHFTAQTLHKVSRMKMLKNPLFDNVKENEKANPGSAAKVNGVKFSWYPADKLTNKKTGL